jgi:hypothetical protein
MHTKNECFQEHISATEAEQEFRSELEGSKFRLTRSQNTGKPYNDAELRKDSAAVKAFTESDLFKSIKATR